jgi:hypothetical protein
MLSKKKIALTYTLILMSIIGISQPSPIFWEHSYGGTNNDESFAITSTRDLGYIMIGSTTSNDGDVIGRRDSLPFNYWVIKTASSGTIEWQKSYGGSINDWGRSIVQTTDGGYAIAGYSSSNDGNVSGHHGDSTTSDCWIVRLDSSGTIFWQRSLGGSMSDVANAIIQTTDGGYAIAGYSYSDDGDVSGHHGDSIHSDYWVAKLDTSGQIIWQRSIGGSKIDIANSIIETLDSGYLVVGYTYSRDGDVTRNSYDTTNADYWVVKLNAAGAIVWQQSYGGGSADMAQQVIAMPDGGYTVVGSSTSNNGMVSGSRGNKDYWLIRLDGLGSLVWQHSYGGSGIDQANSLVLCPDGGVAIIGTTASTDGDVSGFHGNHDMWMVRVDSFGNLDWQCSLGGSSGPTIGSAVTLDPYGGYLGFGYSLSSNGDVTGNHGSWDYWAVDLRPICYPSHVSDTMAICLGSSYGGHSGAGTYTDTLINMGGCDSIRDLLLSVYPTYSSSFYDTICPGSSYMWAGQAYTASGVYLTTFSSSHYCDSTSILHLTVSSLPVRPHITARGDTLSTVVLAGVRYQWQMNGSDIAGATSGSIVAPIQAYYDVVALFGNGCISYSDTVWIYSLGLSDLYTSGLIQLHPNPATESFTLSVKAEMIGSGYTFSDMTGRTIYSNMVEKENTIISLRGLSSGIYILQIEGRSYKVVKD